MGELCANWQSTRYMGAGLFAQFDLLTSTKEVMFWSLFAFAILLLLGGRLSHKILFGWGFIVVM